MGRRRTRRAFSPSLGERISVSRRQRGASLHGYVAVSAAPHGCSNVFLHTSSPARPLGSQKAAPSRSESGLEVATRRVRILKRTRSSHSSARPHRLTSSIPNPPHPPNRSFLHPTISCYPSVLSPPPVVNPPLLGDSTPSHRPQAFGTAHQPTHASRPAHFVGVLRPGLVARPTSRARLHRTHHNTVNRDAFGSSVPSHGLYVLSFLLTVIVDTHFRLKVIKHSRVSAVMSFVSV